MKRTTAYIYAQLRDLYPDSEIRALTQWILEKISGLTRTQLLTSKSTIFSETQYAAIKNIIERLRQHEPIQYIFGETDFRGLTFTMNSSVLIPRPETSDLIDCILQIIPNQPHFQVLDIGCGSGCIAISLAHARPAWSVSAWDISPEALQTTRINAKKNEVKINTQQVDILLESPAQNWNLIVSNPPYICEIEKAEMEPNVLLYEPAQALFVPDSDPLLFYRNIARYAEANLQKNGYLCFEINRAYGKEMCLLLKNSNFKNIEIQKDISGNDRIVIAQK